MPWWLIQPIMIPELSVVMPAYNEEAILPSSLAEAFQSLDAIAKTWELIVVDDGSTDQTATILRELCVNEPRLRVLTQPTNLGYSAALIRGFAACQYEALFYTDADAQFDLHEIALAYPLLSNAEMVAGWRRRRRDPWIRRFASAVFNRLQQVVLGARAKDVDCAFKLFRRSFFQRVQLSSQGFLIDAEIYARAAQVGLRVVQLPVTHRARTAGRSSVRPITVFRTLVELGRLRSSIRSTRARATEVRLETTGTSR
jgi:glycosyltransferase involved in cell wall biosynthesis